MYNRVSLCMQTFIRCFFPGDGVSYVYGQMRNDSLGLAKPRLWQSMKVDTGFC